jgi:hypothetical protein
MTHHDAHGHDHGKHHDHHHTPRKRGIHKDWRAWAVVILMLAAMWMYLRSMDESIQPSGEVRPGMPAAPAPPAPAPVGMTPTENGPLPPVPLACSRVLIG